MSNHYHLLLEAPQANLSLGWVGCRTRSRDGQARGMSFAIIFWGTLQRNFDRAGEVLLGALDYIHLNPVGAGIIAEKALQSLYDGSKWKKRRNRA
jgi:hypothetical protein